MKLQTTVAGTVTVRASLGEDETLKVSLVLSAPYASVRRDDGAVEERTCAATVEVTDAALRAAVGAALKGVLAQAAALGGPALQQAIYQARAVAQTRGELEGGR